MAGEAFGLRSAELELELAALFGSARPRTVCPDCGTRLEFGGAELLGELELEDREFVLLFGGEVYRCPACRMVGSFSPVLRGL